MDNINGLLGGFADVITPMNLLIALLGVLIGTFVGHIFDLSTAQSRRPAHAPSPARAVRANR